MIAAIFRRYMKFTREKSLALISVIATALLVGSLYILINIQKKSPDSTKKTMDATARRADKQASSQGFGEPIISGIVIQPICPVPTLIGKIASSASLAVLQKAKDNRVPALPIPNLRMEFNFISPSHQKPEAQQNAEFVTVQFSSQTNELLNRYWDVFCNYYFKIGKIKEPEAKKELMRELMNARRNFAASLQKAQINAPDGKRCICEEEAWEVVNLLTLSAQEAMGQYLNDKPVGKTTV
jgi:hypothetical protein